ncbi:hypothetical protein KEM48_011583 [Puccinia striiformis f. sp. tritici PST-130]|nr:hypothetical protein KEM48_011583 [Puccinia striiformis f. sp. tritici PST-130]
MLASGVQAVEARYRPGPGFLLQRVKLRVGLALTHLLLSRLPDGVSYLTKRVCAIGYSRRLGSSPSITEQTLVINSQKHTLLCVHLNLSDSRCSRTIRRPGCHKRLKCGKSGREGTSIKAAWLTHLGVPHHHLLQVTSRSRLSKLHSLRPYSAHSSVYSLKVLAFPFLVSAPELKYLILETSHPRSDTIAFLFPRFLTLPLPSVPLFCRAVAPLQTLVVIGHISGHQAKSSPGYSHLSSRSINKSLVSNLLGLKDQPLRSPLFSKDYRNMINFRSNGTLLSVLWVMAITAGFALGASVLGRDGPRKGCIEQLHCKGSNE